MPVKLLTSGGGGVNLVPSSSIASDQTMYLPTSGTSGGTVLCTDSTGGTANGVLYLNGSKQVTSGSGLVFDSSGNLLVGTTSQNDAVACRVNIKWASASGYGVSSRTDANDKYHYIFDNAAGSAVGAIYCTASSTTFATSSDYRLKNTIQPMTGALAKVTALKPVTYKWNIDNSDGEGFIAHELAEVCPYAVIGEKDAVNEDGTPHYQSIDTSFLVATLTAAIQEQQAIIESLTQRIEALEYTKQGE